ncbi:Urease accessory protein UreD 2 [Beijerinckiaceae bacterium RH AL1]|nr:urease accessory protein UreD [Beijerinckiaceae bacterium]VVB46892.1 Urease accessory protein UreD 2 [Beijerinckiaceae bacterium RH CH11]VVB46975.1 Urease accessory protein UreD 2 [Beijerinckiaceae bacterium RH AL8]VVC55611.1 Urease accessory protein UreD 2 [Beijerinckiaceae bacterium RH AL1]
MTRGLVDVGRHVAAHLAFAVGGNRTVLARQLVPYPFHITKPFRLDAARPDLATLYLQSASGGLYRGDDLTLRIAAGAGAAAHLVTQAATVVHDTGASPARQRVEIEIGPEAFLAYTPDPLVMFSGAAIDTMTRVTLADGARAIVSDAFAMHDPKADERPFAALSQRFEVVDASGRTAVRDIGRIAGAAIVSDASPLGPFRAFGTLAVLAPAEALPAPAVLRAAGETCGGLAGVTSLPGSAGLMVRCLADDGGGVRRGLEAAFEVAFASLVGTRPAPRRR